MSTYFKIGNGLVVTFFLQLDLASRGGIWSLWVVLSNVVVYAWQRARYPRCSLKSYIHWTYPVYHLSISNPALHLLKLGDHEDSLKARARLHDTNL